MIQASFKRTCRRLKGKGETTKLLYMMQQSYGKGTV